MQNYRIKSRKKQNPTLTNCGK